jgi:hypothetical protein
MIPGTSVVSERRLPSRLTLALPSTLSPTAQRFSAILVSRPLRDVLSREAFVSFDPSSVKIALRANDHETSESEEFSLGA